MCLLCEPTSSSVCQHMLLFLIPGISGAGIHSQFPAGRSLSCDSPDPNGSAGFRYSVLQEKKEHQGSEFPHADCPSLAEVFLETFSLPYTSAVQDVWVIPPGDAHPWFCLGWCWHMVIAQENSSLSCFISLTLSTRDESFTPPQCGVLISPLTQ